MNRGGSARILAVSTALGLARDPMASVSDSLIIGYAWNRDITLERLVSFNAGTGRWSGFSTEPATGLADSWDRFNERARANGLTAAAASG